MIQLNGVSMKFDGKEVLSDLNLSVNTGSAFGLLGANGAGKSTILRLLSGIYKQTSGEVLIDGEEVYDNRNAKGKIFFINDETVQYNHYTLKEIKDFYKGYYPKFSEEIYETLKNTVKLPEDKKLNQFSKGMKRQAIVIIGLACQPDYLLLDEAFDGLDPTMRIIVKKMLINAMVERNLTTIISSHNLKEIGEICDCVALVYGGKVVFSKEIDDVTGNVHKIQIAFGENQGKDTFKELDILHYEMTGSITSMIVRGNSEEIRQVIAPMKPIVFDMIPLTLEEVFIYEMEGLGYEGSFSDQ